MATKSLTIQEYKNTGLEKKNIPQLVKLLDKEFSIFIRRRDASNEGYGKCITCPRIINWKDGDCGHFMGRQHYATRWHEMNCNLQCKACNNWGQGEQAIHAKEIDKKFGAGTSDALIILSRSSEKLNRTELIVKIRHYKTING